ncbi:hypothetical protein [Blastococcus sp. TF02A-26]|uniref:hypothetical protein n=1 Tax=Blastococcus sp. TF02A-26 TaxID=2250577 RepID=UPI000DEBE9F7|nr:hypothetical protein [Blastococcus sp. TF02A-26]RBY90708.1 hypothetical protein DQ240_01160 [Blastococcus sp. TF02A-26]
MSPDLTPDSAAESSPAEATDAGSTDAGSTDAASAVASATSTAPVRPAGDLDSGSLTRVLAAGAQDVVIDYWTADQATAWTTTGEKNLQLSAHVEGGSEEDTEVLVTRFVVTADDGVSRTVAVEDRGEFALMRPFSYSTAFTVPESAPTADAVTLYVQFDLLVETEPGSQRYYRQTVLDTLELPLLQEASA